VDVLNTMDLLAESGPATAAVSTAFISWLALALMTTNLVASLSPSPTMVVYGLVAGFPYLVPAIVFLLPTSLVALAEALCLQRYPATR
jgi:hypothetical protein